MASVGLNRSGLRVVRGGTMASGRQRAPLTPKTARVLHQVRSLLTESAPCEAAVTAEVIEAVLCGLVRARERRAAAGHDM